MTPGPWMVALALVLAACAPDIPASPSPTGRDPSTLPMSTGTPAPSVPSAEPGRPYDGAAILDAMRTSTRPGGVPDQIETGSIAAAVAEHIWTYDGSAWDTMLVGGACRPSRCTLDLVGVPASAAGIDLYSLGVDPTSAEVELVDVDLHGYPPKLDGSLEALVRDGLSTARLRGLAYAGARWLPPPDIGRFWVAFRSGGEEGSGGLDVLVDLAAGRILTTRTTRS